MHGLSIGYVLLPFQNFPDPGVLNASHYSGICLCRVDSRFWDWLGCLNPPSVLTRFLQLYRT